MTRAAVCLATVACGTPTCTGSGARAQDLKQNATVMAWFAWQAAGTAERVPRP